MLICNGKYTYDNHTIQINRHHLQTQYIIISNVKYKVTSGNLRLNS